MSGSSPAGPLVPGSGGEGAMRIGDLAKATGTSPRMLRYYEQQGLLRSRRETNGHSVGHRRYDGDAVATVVAIRALLAAGVSTSVVYDLLPCVQGPGPVLQRCAAPVLQAQLERVREQMTALRHAERRLIEVIESSSA